MAVIMYLAIILHFSATCGGIGIREIYFNDSEPMEENTVPPDLNEHRNDDENSTQNHASVNGRNVSRLGKSDTVNGDNVTNDDNTRDVSHTADTNMVTIDINETTSNITYRNLKGFELPEEWIKFCHIGEGRVYSSEFTPPVNLTEIKCSVTPDYSGVWKMSVLRQHLGLYESSGFKYSVDIRCESWSNISLSWPIKIANVYFLTVQHCQIKDFLAEFDKQLIQSTPDSLRVLNLSDNKLLVATDTYLSVTMNVSKMLPEYNCGHDETLESLSLRNISYGFIDSVDFVYKKLTELGAKFILDAKRRQVKCDYKHLMLLDESQSVSMSVYHMELKESIFYELKVYNVSYSYIKALKDKQLQWSVTFPKLETYDLSHNQISKLYRFEIPLHTSLDRVTTLNLQYNKITSISVEDLERFKQMPMVFIDLRNNPIQCNCTANMKQLLAYVREQKYLEISNLSDYSYIKDLQCASPERLQSRTLESLTDLEGLCVTNVEKEYFLVPILILSVTIVVLSVMLFALLRYRKEVLIILFTRFNIIIPCHQRHASDSSKKYDAFVSYSSKEEEWVESLFENLELQLINGNRHFRFCLHHRDFIPGKTIYDNVIKSVESSRHTIILLSNNFLKSEFCLYEFQEAFRQSIMEQKRHLVIVMMEELDPDKLPRDLRRCIQTFTYIKKDDYLFRERLIYALSVKQKNQVAKSKTHKGKNSSSTADKNRTKTSTPSEKTSKNENKGSGNNTQSNTKNTLKSNGKLSKVAQNQQLHQQSDSTDQSCTEKKVETNHKYSDNSYTAPSAKIEEACVNIQTYIRHNVKEVKAEKCLALNIESDAGIPLSELGCNRCTVNIDMAKPNDNGIEIDEDISTRTTDYDRSMSTVSHDTGYFSEKGSPDICSQECASFDKNIFPNEIDITDFEV